MLTMGLMMALAAATDTVSEVSEMSTRSEVSTKSEVSASATTTATSFADNSSQYDVLRFSIGEGDRFYNHYFQVGDNAVDLRLDIIQPDLWVLNKNSFMNCSYIQSWLSSKYSVYSDSTLLPCSVTTASEYTISMCAAGGGYLMPTSAPQPVNNPSLSNNVERIIPYVDGISASGQWQTNNVKFNISNGSTITFNNFTFVNANQSSVAFGGLGLAGSSLKNGFLYQLYNQNLIKSPGYSIYFNNNTADLIPGVIDQKFYDGDFFVYPVLPHQNLKYINSPTANQVIEDLNFPSIQLDNIKITNEVTKQSVDLTSGPLPVVLDTRSTYNYVPLDILVNLAIQTNAFYSNEASRWIVECDVIQNSNSTLNFNIGQLNIKIPLNLFIVPAVHLRKNLKFKGGEKACYLNFLPTAFNGVDCLGLKVLNHLYLAVDNEGKNIALGLASRENDQDNDEVNNDNQSLSSQKYSNTTTIGDIESGTIPFATKASYSTTLTLTLSPLAKATFNGGDIPARFTGAVISGNEIYILGDNSLYSTVSAATQNSSISLRGLAISRMNPIHYVQSLSQTSIIHSVLFMITFIGLLLL
jgi:hypothetical protein